jgi:hypothetical protein
MMTEDVTLQGGDIVKVATVNDTLPLTRGMTVGQCAVVIREDEDGTTLVAVNGNRCPVPIWIETEALETVRRYDA